MFLRLVLVSVFYSTHAQIFTTSAKKGEGCTSVKTLVTEQITECVLSCRGMENITSLYDHETKTCRCVEESCLAEESSPQKSNSSAYYFKGEDVGYYSSYEDAVINFRYDEGEKKNTGTGGNTFSIWLPGGGLTPDVSKGYLTTRHTPLSTNGPYFTGLGHIPCLSKGMLQDECTKSGLTFALRFRDPNVTATSQSTMNIISPHGWSDLGFYIHYGGQKVTLQLWSNSFSLGCSPKTVNIYEWNHFVISVRIRPTLRMFCFHNGELFAENGNYTPKTAGVKVAKMFIGWRYGSGHKHALDFDDIALWERYIEANEVKRIYQGLQNDD
ncbi:uncharacterized protein [Clytia hemisphaerica]|uniref:Uncharacterized protein n=1 Tax=Clytia hemisphaerica TaxID=252671 RepID=A0A7M5VFE7_9CNID